MKEALSSFVQSAVQRARLPTPATVLDLPSGSGRHSRWLAALGHLVVAADIDPTRLGRCITTREKTDSEHICRVVADAGRELPFRPRSFDLVVMVHFIAANIVQRVKPLIRQSGYFIFESFGAHGENWRDLPAPGSMAEALNDGFDLLDYRERQIGPAGGNAAIVKFLACLK